MSQQTSNLILPLALFGGGLYAVSKLFPGEGQKGKEINDAAQRLEAERRNLGENPTYPELAYKSYALALHESMRFSAVADNYANAEAILKAMKNTLDVVLLIQAFGLRKETWFGVIPDGPPKSLPEFVRDDLATWRIDRINKDYHQKVIAFRF